MSENLRKLAKRSAKLKKAKKVETEDHYYKSYIEPLMPQVRKFYPDIYNDLSDKVKKTGNLYFKLDYEILYKYCPDDCDSYLWKKLMVYLLKENGIYAEIEGTNTKHTCSEFWINLNKKFYPKKGKWDY